LKQFRKTQEGYFICEECGQICKIKSGLSYHINKSHNGLKEYFDKYLKEKDEELCKICGIQTEFRNLKIGYKYSCYNHRFEYSEILKRKNNQEKYGVDNVFQLEDVISKCIIGSRKTCMRKYGVESTSQVKEIHEKTEKSGFKAKKFRNTTLYYRGCNELDFLENYYDKYPYIQNGPRIKYIFEGKEHYYFPDFYIPSLNLIVEIKSTWIAKKQGIECVKSKEKATIASGFKYIIILDYDYSNCEF